MLEQMSQMERTMLQLVDEMEDYSDTHKVAIDAAIMARQIAPPVLNLEQPDPLADGLDLIAGRARAHAIEHAMLNGFGFGGVNASLVLKRFTA